MNSSTVVDAHEVLLSGVDFDRLTRLADSPSCRKGQWRASDLLREDLGRGVVVPPDQVPPDLVTMRSRVRVKDLRGREAGTYTLAYPHEVDMELKKVSVLAPIGAALLGARVGDVIVVRAPGGIRRLRIDRLLYQPESAGDFEL